MTDSRLKNYTTSILFELWTQKFKRKYRIPNDKTHVAITDAFVHFLRIVLHAQIKPGKRFIKAQAPYFLAPREHGCLQKPISSIHCGSWARSHSLNAPYNWTCHGEWEIHVTVSFQWTESALIVPEWTTTLPLRQSRKRWPKHVCRKDQLSCLCWLWACLWRASLWQNWAEVEIRIKNHPSYSEGQLNIRKKSKNSC